MKVKKKQMIKHSRFVLNSPFLDKAQEKIGQTNEKVFFFSKRAMAVLVAITTMATPLMSSPVYAKSSTSTSSTAGNTSDSDKDVETSSSAEINDEAGEEPEPYQCSGDSVDYENTELLTDGDGAGEITCAQSNGIYYKLTDGNKASSYHWIAWYRDKSKDEADITDDDGNYSGFSSSKVSAWQPYQSEIEELNDGSFPETQNYTYPTDTTTGTLDFWADIAGNYTVLGDPKYDSLELTAYEQVVYARTEEVSEPYEIPSDEDVDADDAGGAASGDSSGGSGSGIGDTGNGTVSSDSEPNLEYQKTWTKYIHCNNQDRVDLNKILNQLGYNNTKYNDTDKNGMEAEQDLIKSYKKSVNKIADQINDIMKKYGCKKNLDEYDIKDITSWGLDKTELKKAKKEIKKIFNSDDFEKYYKEQAVVVAISKHLSYDDKGTDMFNSKTTPSTKAGRNQKILSLLQNFIDYNYMASPSYTSFNVSDLDKTEGEDKETFNNLKCSVQRRSVYKTYEKEDGTTVYTRLEKRHDNLGTTSYTTYVWNDGKWLKQGKTKTYLEAFTKYTGDEENKENYKQNYLDLLLGNSGTDETNIDSKMTKFEKTDSQTDSQTDSTIKHNKEKLEYEKDDNEIIGDPTYEAGEASYSDDLGYTVITSTTTTYYYMNVVIAKATIDNVYATEIAQLENLGIVKGAGNEVQAKVSQDSDGFWGSTTPSYWENDGTITINNDSSTIYHFDKVDSRNNYGYTDEEYTVDLYSLLMDHDKISKFIHGYNNIKDSNISSKNYPSNAEENCITTKSSTGKSSQVCSKAQTPLMKQTLIINEDSQDQEELDDDQVETTVTLTKDNDKEDDSSD